MANSPPVTVENDGAELRVALAVIMVWLLICAVYLLGVPGALEMSTTSLLALLLTFAGMFFPVLVIIAVARVAANVSTPPLPIWMTTGL